MSDRTLLIILVIFEALSVYNLYDTASTMLMHLGKSSYSANGTVEALKRAMRRDRAGLLVPKHKDSMLNSADIKCDYLMDLSFRTEKGEHVYLKNFVVPSFMKLTAGSTMPLYREGQTLPLKCSRRLKKLAVVDLPEVRRRQCSWLWLFLWILTVVVLGWTSIALAAAL